VEVPTPSTRLQMGLSYPSPKLASAPVNEALQTAENAQLHG
jgi:hypothetical protein